MVNMDTVNRPFGLPNRELLTHVVHLPFPPSLNILWRHAGKRVHRSTQYMAWIANANNLGLYLKQAKGPRIEGSFAADIALDRNERRRCGDLDNRATKAVLDIVQAWGLIANDRNCDDIHAYWGAAPHGCRLLLTELA